MFGGVNILASPPWRVPSSDRNSGESFCMISSSTLSLSIELIEDLFKRKCFNQSQPNKLAPWPLITSNERVSFCDSFSTLTSTVPSMGSYFPRYVRRIMDDGLRVVDSDNKA